MTRDQSLSPDSEIHPRLPFVDHGPHTDGDAFMGTTMQEYQLTIGSILRHGTTVHGDQTVVTGGDRPRRTTFREIGKAAACLANGLAALGVGRNSRVGTFMWNNQEHLTAYLAVPAMGAVLHTLNLRLPPEQIVFIANQARDRVVLVDLSLVDQLAAVLSDLASVHTVIAVGEGDIDVLHRSGKRVLCYGDLLGQHSEDYRWPDLDERSAAAICYTSGTTGDPKGVVYSHRSTYLHAMSTNLTNGFGIGADDVVLPVVPMFHVNAWGMPYGAMMAGASLVLPDRRLDATSLVDLIEIERPTIAAGVPTVWNDVLHQLDRESHRDISSLHRIICGGSAVPVSLIRTFEQRHGIEVRQLWGMTETSPLATIAAPSPALPDPERLALKATQGRPICGVEARIVGDDGVALPADGESLGELQVRGPWVTGGYYRSDDNSKFDNGWLRTGDVGHIDPDGFVTLTDRAKDVIKSGGEWISSVELENHLISHPSVVEAAVVGIPDARWQERPLAAVALCEGAETSASELRKYLEDKVVRWWLPEYWTFVDRVPRTSVGKFDKKVIRARHQADEYQVTVVRE